MLNACSAVGCVRVRVGVRYHAPCERLACSARKREGDPRAMKPTSLLRPASSIFLLHALTAISSQPSSHSMLHLLSRHRRRFSSTPNLNFVAAPQISARIIRHAGCRNSSIKEGRHKGMTFNWLQKYSSDTVAFRMII